MKHSAVLLGVLCCLTNIHVSAQEPHVYIHEGDTLRYTYTPLVVEEYPTNSPAKRSKKGFFHRLANYFEGSTQDRTFEKKIDFTFAGGIGYSKNTNVSFGVLAAGQYRVDRTDSITQPSNITLFGNVSVTGVYAIGVSGYNLWNRNKQRIHYSVSFSSEPRSVWGKGYDAGRYAPETKYVEKDYRINTIYQQRIFRNTYLGLSFDFQHTRGKDFDRIEILGSEKQRYTATGLGIVVEYDSRDFISAPSKGFYLSFKETLFPESFGSCNQTLWRTKFIMDYYRPLWQGSVLATDLYAEFNSNGTPWPMLSRMGGMNRMRGYYQGRYTDNDLITFQVELRQKIWRRIGCVAWVGAGNVFSELKKFEWKQTLPNYGLGLRWELKQRVNVRMDYGFGKNTHGFMLNINEAF